jgi:hypothetical protein
MTSQVYFYLGKNNEKNNMILNVMSSNVVVIPVVAPVVSGILKGWGWAQGSHAAIGQVTGCQGPDFVAKTILNSIIST